MNVEQQAIRTIDRYMDQVFDLDGFVIASLEGIRSLRVKVGHMEWQANNHELLKSIKPSLEAVDAEYVKRLAWLSESFSKDSAHQHLLFNQATVLLWSHIESVCGEVIFLLLGDENHAKRCQALKHIKVTADLLYLDRDERVQSLYNELLREKRVTFQPGIAGYEDLFSDFGVGDALSDLVRRTFIELKEVRNLIVHRNSVVDEKFRRSAPFSRWTQMQSVKVGYEDLSRYFVGSILYLMTIIHRMEQQGDSSKGKVKRGALDELERILVELSEDQTSTRWFGIWMLRQEVQKDEPRTASS